jgi:prepilin-type N-terminal cleavage/methylation domain-containing protein
VFDTLFERHRELQRRRAEEGFDGFTLIELLIVIVVIAILAATVIFALGGIQGSSAKAACNSDAKSVETAVAAYHAYPQGSGGWPASVAALTQTANGGPFLQNVPNNTHYAITVDPANGNVMVAAPATATPVQYDAPGATTNPCDAAS